MSAERWATPRRRRLGNGRGGTAGGPDGATPLRKGLLDVRLTELEANGPALRATRLAARHRAVDAVQDDTERHAGLGPARDELERRADHANQVAAIATAEIGLDLAAVGADVERCDVPVGGRLRHRTRPTRPRRRSSA